MRPVVTLIALIGVLIGPAPAANLSVSQADTPVVVSNSSGNIKTINCTSTTTPVLLASVSVPNLEPADIVLIAAQAQGSSSAGVTQWYRYLIEATNSTAVAGNNVNIPMGEVISASNATIRSSYTSDHGRSGTAFYNFIGYCNSSTGTITLNYTQIFAGVIRR